MAVDQSVRLGRFLGDANHLIRIDLIAMGGGSHGQRCSAGAATNRRFLVDHIEGVDGVLIVDAVDGVDLSRAET